jgi:hypothetical protein
MEVEMSSLFEQRIDLYRDIEKVRNSKVISYLLGDNPNFSTQIAKDVINFFGETLDSLGSVLKITLVLYTVGGDTLAAWNIINLISQYCDELEIIIPFKAQSAGTLMTLRANKILMTKKSVLGPIDPSINTPLNPQIQTNIPNLPPQPYPVSVESIREYLNYAKDELGLTGDSLAKVYTAMSEKIHPLVIGQSIRTLNQIKMLAKKLIDASKVAYTNVDEVVKFLCSESGSHDYTINYQEALQLGLPVEEINGDLEKKVNELFNNFSKELYLSEFVNFADFLPNGSSEGHFSISSGLIESTNSINYSFKSTGIVRKQLLPNNQYHIVPNFLMQSWTKNEVKK